MTTHCAVLRHFFNMTENDVVLNPGEIEFFVQTLKPSNISLIGSKGWFDEHQRLERLRQQCVFEARNNVAEFVKDVVLTFEKMPVLVHEVIVIQIWRQKVWKKILKEKLQMRNSFVAYMILYHECTAVNFLQVLMHHKDSVENLKDECLDLIDYCASQIVYLSSEKFQQEDVNPEDEISSLRGQQKEMMLNTGLASIAIIASLAEYLDVLTLSAVVRLFETHDFPILLVNMIRIQPWKQKQTVYSEGRWEPYDAEELRKNEAQCWIALRGLLLHPAAKQHYELTAFRKDTLTSVQKFLTENIIDQLPPLIELRQYLAQLTMSSQSRPNRSPIILETVAPIRDALLSQNQKWKQLTEWNLSLVFSNEHKEELLDIAKSVAETYQDGFPEEKLGPCAGCGKPARKRCSKCKEVYYCTRKCQVSDWVDHKLVCGSQN